MKIAVIGFSGCGKSTLSRRLAALYQAEILHLDSIHFLPDWVERDTEEERSIVQAFLDRNRDWVIDGNYTKLSYQRRLEEADQIVMMLFGRLDCLRRVVRRYRTFRHTTRPDMAEGCREKLDWNFVTWVLWGGRSRAAMKRYRAIADRYRGKTVILKNQKQLDRYWTGVSSAFLREEDLRPAREAGAWEGTEQDGVHDRDGGAVR